MDCYDRQNLTGCLTNISAVAIFYKKTKESKKNIMSGQVMNSRRTIVMENDAKSSSTLSEDDESLVLTSGMSPTRKIEEYDAHASFASPRSSFSKQVTLSLPDTPVPVTPGGGPLRGSFRKTPSSVGPRHTNFDGSVMESQSPSLRGSKRKFMNILPLGPEVFEKSDTVDNKHSIRTTEASIDEDDDDDSKSHADSDSVLPQLNRQASKVLENSPSEKAKRFQQLYKRHWRCWLLVLVVALLFTAMAVGLTKERYESSNVQDLLAKAPTVKKTSIPVAAPSVMPSISPI